MTDVGPRDWAARVSSQATERQCGAGRFLQMKLQQTQPHVSGLRSSEMPSRNYLTRREYIRVAELSSRNTAQRGRHISALRLNVIVALCVPAACTDYRFRR